MTGFVSVDEAVAVHVINSGTGGVAVSVSVGRRAEGVKACGGVISLLVIIGESLDVLGRGLGLGESEGE